MAGARLLIIADGMGGHRGGRRASRTCVDAFARVFREQQGDPKEQLQKAFLLANEEIHRASLEEPEYRGMGTTAVTLYFSTDGRVHVGWVGDSRAYVIRQGKLETLTQDHALVAEWLRMGVLTPEQAASHPRRSELTRAIGIHPSIEADIRVLDVEADDRFLLCSDGLSGLVEEDDIRRIVAEEDPESGVESLVDHANARGGTDNVSVQIACIPPVALSAAEAPDDSGDEFDFSFDDDPDPASNRLPAAPLTQARPVRGLHIQSSLLGLALGAAVASLCFAFWPRQSSEVRIAASTTATASSATPPSEMPSPAPELASASESPKPPEPVVPSQSDPLETAALDPIPEASDSEPQTKTEAEPESGTEPELSGAATAVEPTPGATDAASASLPASRPPDSVVAPQVPTELPTTTALEAPPEIHGFLDEWLAAATLHDYRRYRALGFPDAPDLFTRTYANWSDYRMVEIEIDEARSAPDRVYLRAVLSYAFENAEGRWRTQDEHRLILGSTPAGLRYLARWK